MSRRRNLLTARVAGICAVGLVGHLAADMPDGYLGPRDTVSLVGALFSVAWVVLCGGVILAVRHRDEAGTLLPPLLYSALVGFFIPPMAADPVVAGSIVLYCVMLLLQHFFPASQAAGWRGEEERADRGGRLGPPLRHLIGVSLALTVAVVGYRLSGHPLAQATLLGVDLSCLVMAWPLLRHGSFRAFRFLHSSWALVGAVLVAVLLTFLAPRPAYVAFSLLLVTVLLRTLGQERVTAEVLHGFYDRPSRLVALSFVALIALGTLFLTFPAASSARPLAPLDALFTATSASCVTGLVVLDTGSDFSLLGQVVILLLIQVGGLGIMTLSTFGTLLLGGSLGLKGEQALRRVLDLQAPTNAYRLIRFIVVLTLALEAVGAVILALCFRAGGLGWGAAIWRGVFHAVSAFCNAGFALQSDSLVAFENQPLVLLTIAALIVTGGVGFIVLAALWARLTAPERRPWNLQVKVVAAATVVLLAGGMLAVCVFEWEGALAGQATSAKLVNGFFQSVTLRTAGFNSIDMEALQPASRWLMILWMFVGGAPGSTAGGIKVTTAVVLLAALRSASRPRGAVTLFRREVPHEVVYRGLAILVLSAVAVALTFLALLLVERQPFDALLFEAVSAFGTVGLSLGATAVLGGIGKGIVIAAMFIGRIGPLTVALLLGVAESRRAVLRYPESRLMVG